MTNQEAIAPTRQELKEKLMVWVSSEIDKNLQKTYPGQALQLSLVFDILHPDGTSIYGQDPRNSDAAKEWRDQIFKRDGFTCQKCGRVGGNLHAHHIKSWSEFPEKRFDPDNGITVCTACHAALHPGHENLILNAHYKEVTP